MLNEWIHPICLLFLNNKIKTYSSVYLVSLGIMFMLKMFFQLYESVVACILVAAVDKRLHMRIVKVSVCEYEYINIDWYEKSKIIFSLIQFALWHYNYYALYTEVLFF